MIMITSVERIFMPMWVNFCSMG